MLAAVGVTCSLEASPSELDFDCSSIGQKRLDLLRSQASVMIGEARRVSFCVIVLLRVMGESPGPWNF